MNFSESQILIALRELLQPILASGANGLLDDGAQLPPCPANQTRVVSLDAFQEHNDFEIGLGGLQDAGWRAIVQNLSDIAAMGAKPVGFLWSLELPESWLSGNMAYLKDFCLGAVEACRSYGLEFYGGDLSSSRGAFSCAITIFGDVAGRPLGRQGARVGDKIYVSKALGGSAAGLAALMSPRPTETLSNCHPGLEPGSRNVLPVLDSRFRGNDSDLIQQHLRPIPELELGLKLVGHATACMDISDGLAKDLYRLCKASRVGFRLGQIPRAPGATEDHALHGGEDFALLFTGRDLPFGIEIGEITELKEALHEPQGFDHFSSFSKGQAPL